MSANLSEHARVALLIGLPRVGRPKPPTPDPAPPSPAGSLFDGSDDEDVPNLNLDNSKAEQNSSANQTSSAPAPNYAPTPNASAPTTARRLVRTQTAPPATRPSPAQVLAPVPAPPTRQAARPVPLTQLYMAPLPLSTIPETSAQPGNSQIAYNKGTQGVPVEEMRMSSAGPSGGTHPSTSHYALYTQPFESPATPTGPQVPRTMSQQPSGTSGFGSDGSLSVAAWMQGGSTPIQPTALSRSQTFNGFSATGASVSYFSGAYIPPPSMPGSVLGQKHIADAMEIRDDAV